MTDLIENLVYSAIAAWQYEMHSEIYPGVHNQITEFSKEFAKKWKKNQDALD